MPLIDQASILIPDNRQRREHDADEHQELIASILSVGLLQPIVLRDGTTLVAGERRLRAMREIIEMGSSFGYGGFLVMEGMIPFVDLGTLSTLAAMEAEYEENVRRKDLTWQERAVAEDNLYNLRTAQAKEKGLAPPALGDIAKESRGVDDAMTATRVGQSIVLARNLHRPEIKGAATPKEALRALTRVEEGERNVEKATALGKDFLGGKHTLHNGDSEYYLLQYAGLAFDVICTDPIYGMGADEFGDSGGAVPEGAHFYRDDYESWQRMVEWFCPLSFKITKPEAHLYAFCDIDHFHEFKRGFEDAGWTVFRTPLIWYKPSAFRAPWPDKGPQRKYECILYAVKGDLKCTKVAGDVLTYPPDVNLGHNAQKPVALFQDLLSRSLRPGMRVLDPFCGTGPIFPAAHALSGIATGIEMDPAAYAIAAGRVQKLKEGT